MWSNTILNKFEKPPPGAGFIGNVLPSCVCYQAKYQVLVLLECFYMCRTPPADFSALRNSIPSLFSALENAVCKREEKIFRKIYLPRKYMEFLSEFQSVLNTQFVINKSKNSSGETYNCDCYLFLSYRSSILNFCLLLFQRSLSSSVLFLSCNNTRQSKDMASLGFTSVSSPWEVVYYFLPGITGRSQGSSVGSSIIGFCQNTTSVSGLAAGLAVEGCCPRGCCP